MSRCVAIHIELTGPDAVGDDVVAMAAVRIADGREIDRVDLRAKPPSSLPPSVTAATGITDADVAAAPSPESALRSLVRFAGVDPVVSYRPEIDRRALTRRRRGGLPTDIIDLTQFARTVLPALPSHELLALAGHFGLADAMPAAPVDRAALAAQVWQRLEEAAGHLPLVVIDQILRLLDGTLHPFEPVFQHAEKQAMRHAFGETARAYSDLVRDFSKELRRSKQEPVTPIPQLLNVEEVADIFREGGALQQAHPGYEDRPEQVRMAQGVCEAFNNNQFVMIEAGTGVGKSLAYLVPAIFWSRLNNEKIVVSTNTKNLQEQLFNNDIPLLTRSLDVAFNAALIKGRANYLCVRKFLYTLREAERELTLEERVGLLPVVVWFPETDTGDVAENTGFLAGRSGDLWPRVSTRMDECIGVGCRYSGSCFVRLARARSLASDIVVANHSVVFSEMGLESVVLPPHKRIIFDEAHNIERVATEHFARQATPRRLARVMRRLNQARRDGAGQGLLASLRFQISRAGDNVSASAADGLNRQIEPVLRTMESVTQYTEDLAAAVRQLPAGTFESRLRYKAEGLPRGWEDVKGAAAKLREGIDTLMRQVEALKTAIMGLGAGLPESDNLLGEFASVCVALGEFADGLQFCIDGSDANYVYWAEVAPMGRGDHGLFAAPLDIREVMRANVYDQMNTVVFSSATLTVDRRFDFMRARLGLDGLPEDCVYELDVGTSFDFRTQALLGVINFLPDPRDAQEFTRQFCATVIDVLRATRGRSLVLFTSHRMLRESQPVIKQALEPNGIQVLAQGIDGERSTLTRIFRENVTSVLLGTQSFWEGVDVVGEALSCLILAKLPFQVHTDPIVEARCELIDAQGGNAFYEYTVPTAVIRLKQGFGRLIRTREDRGVVLIADRRLVTKSYGRPFIRSLPTPTRAYRRPDQMIRAVEQFLEPGPPRR